MINLKEEYLTTWRNKWITSSAKSIDDFIRIFDALAEKFRDWKKWGIKLVDDGSVGDDYATFIADDMETAIKAGFIFYMGEDRNTTYLETTERRHVIVPKELLGALKKNK